jgi:hypothetical protein
MPKYRFHLANGQSLVLEGDRMPTDEEVVAAADQANVRALLMRTNDRPSQSTPGSSAVPVGVAASAGMQALPAVVSAVNIGARMAGSAAWGIGAGKLGAAGVALDVANDLRRGEPIGAVKSVVTGAAASQAPRVLQAIERMTAPATSRVSTVLDAAGKPASVPVPAGALTDRIQLVPTVLPKLSYDTKTPILTGADGADRGFLRSAGLILSES